VPVLRTVEDVDRVFDERQGRNAVVARAYADAAAEEAALIAELDNEALERYVDALSETRPKPKAKAQKLDAKAQARREELLAKLTAALAAKKKRKG
jgi:vacuolar-type H+-ATPase subunit H